MTTIAGIRDKIEGVEFASRTRHASGFGTTLGIVAKSPEIRELIASQATGELCEFLADRIMFLASELPDPRYENPNDVALFAYLFVMSQASTEMAETFAEWTLQAPNLWHARHLGEMIKSRMASTEASETSSPTDIWRTDSSERKYTQHASRSTQHYRFVEIAGRPEPGWSEIPDTPASSPPPDSMTVVMK